MNKEWVTLLPSTSLPIERALDAIAARQFSLSLAAVDRNPLTCDAALLPYLAYQWRVEIDGLKEEEQRRLIFNAKWIRKYEGTPYAVKKALGSVFEGASLNEYSGDRVFEFSAVIPLIADAHAVYDSEQFARAVKLVNRVKNARSRLTDFDIAMPEFHAPLFVVTSLTINFSQPNPMKEDAA